jgi:dTDP-4-dehydrorhamnose 3,5-epimerase
MTNLKFNHDKVSTSRQHVLRGIHGDTKSWKLIECLYGELYFVVVDNRPESKNYKNWTGMMLSDKIRRSVLLPPGFGNGFLVMSEHSIFHYKWAYEGKYPDVDDQFTLKWNDPELDIEWPIDNPILQKRDK